MTLTLAASNVKKVFNRRTIFSDISFSLRSRETLLITGRNGSGKSTLVKILSDVLTPTAGSVSLSVDEDSVTDVRSRFIGLVSPYLQMYDEFSAEENLRYALSIRGLKPINQNIHELLRRVFLFERKDDPVRTYSSGMKQRMKYAFALSHQPEILILDEPTANLDAEGISMVKQLMAEHKSSGILIVATNDLSDLEQYDARVDLNARS